MVEPISTGAALVGAGAWFANKLIGPTADRLGESFRDYVNDRMRAVFARSQAIAQEKEVEVKQLPPGLTMKLIQGISYSDETLNEKWANLLVSASKEFSPRHALFSDILSQIGAEEASILDKFFPDSFPFDSTFLPQNLEARLAAEVKFRTQSPKMQERWEALREISFLTEPPLSQQAVERFNEVIGTSYSLDDESELAVKNGWPVSISSLSEIGTAFGDPAIHNNIYHGEGASYDVLERQSLVRRSRIPIETEFAKFDVHCVFPSQLGSEFVKTCRGIDL